MFTRLAFGALLALALLASGVIVARTPVQQPAPAAHGPAAEVTLTAGPRLVVQELRGAVTLVWEITPAAPEQRRLLARLAHREGHSPRLALSPDGTRLAAALLPPGDADLTAGAQLLLLDFGDGTPRLLAHGVDGQALPVWRPDGLALAFRRWQGATPLIAVTAPEPGGAVVAYDWPGALHLSATGWDGDGRLLAAAMTQGGFDLVALEAKRLVAHLSDGPARAFALSPDRRRVSFLSDLSADGAHLQTLNLGAAGKEFGAQSLGVGVFGAVWRPDGALVMGGADGVLQALSYDGPALTPQAGVPLLTGLPQPRTGAALDVPVVAGPGGWLAVRRLEGASSAAPERERLLLMGPGSAAALEADGPLEAVGWRVMP